MDKLKRKKFLFIEFNAKAAGLQNLEERLAVIFEERAVQKIVEGNKALLVGRVAMDVDLRCLQSYLTGITNSANVGEKHKAVPWVGMGEEKGYKITVL